MELNQEEKQVEKTEGEPNPLEEQVKRNAEKKRKEREAREKKNQDVMRDFGIKKKGS